VLKTIPLHTRVKTPNDPIIDFFNCLGLDTSNKEHLVTRLPFSTGDATCGSENELQVVVEGQGVDVDLPQIIVESNYYKNIMRRHRRGELPVRVITSLERWLEGDGRNIWENSWVRLPAHKLGSLADRVFKEDLNSDKTDPNSGPRTDAARFVSDIKGESHIRIPVSYLLKLALVDAVDRHLDRETKTAGLKLARHFLCDNTSPETFSLYVAGNQDFAGLGRAAASEMAIRFLLTQLLVQYAGQKFGLLDSGQKVIIYSAPHPPVRQKELADCITDAFYRELFMNPCLSGWDRGEDKHRYMHLCHETLSRAQLNALSRLKEAGIITTNLVVMPSSSNISLANNGVHVSLGSRCLTDAMQGSSPRIDAVGEKYVGDLVIKFVEHFLPLFVGVYSAAPYRLDFKDFHPEKILSFLPYELDYTHLRMIWRRWRKKAHIKSGFLGVRLTPFGPPLMDTALAWVLRLRGDFLPDFRLIDYLVSVMSTDQCAALDGTLGNQERLKKDLAELGVFDARMPVYLLYRQRLYGQMGFSGFEGRYYSLFHGFFSDLAPAVDLQNLITGLAFLYMATGRLSHDHVPDDPMIESERRQIFFGAAIGLPTFYVRTDTKNLFLRSIIEQTAGVRLSRRYPGHWRVRQTAYRRALIDLLKKEAPPLIEALDLSTTLTDLEDRLSDPDRYSACGKVTQGVLKGLEVNGPLAVSAGEFNRAAEDYYRVTLRRRQMAESCDALIREATNLAISGMSAVRAGDIDMLNRMKTDLLNETASLEEITTAIRLIVLISEHKNGSGTKGRGETRYDDRAPVYRQAHR
jgi:hypothetical protein